MATLSSNASRDDIEDEILLQQAMLDSLGDEELGDNEQRKQLEAVIEELELRLDNLSHTDSVGTSATSPAATDSGEHDAGCATGSKRPGDDISDLTSAKRPAHESAGASQRSFGSSHSQSTSAASSAGAAARARDRHRQYEEAVRKRYEAERADAEYAASLDLSDAQSFGAGLSQTPTMQASSERHAPLFRHNYGRPPVTEPREGPDLAFGNYARSIHQLVDEMNPRTTRSPPANRPSVKAESTLSPRQGRPINETPSVVDLTGDSTSNGPVVLSPAPSDSTRTLSHRMAPRPLPDNQVPGAWPSSQNPYHSRPMTTEERLAKARAEMARLGHVYPSLAGPSSAHRPAPTSIYQPLPQTLGGSAKGWGRSLSSIDNDLAQLGNLLHKATGGEEEEEVEPWYAGLRSTGARHPPEPYEENPEEFAEDLQNLVDNIHPDEEIPVDEKLVDIPGLKIKLKPYQGVGLTWLQNAENGSNKGGILADDMGLGKTIQALSLMLTQTSDDYGCKTTLIVAPVALLRQWKEEIENRVEFTSRMSVFIHHGPQKKKKFAELRTYDVVLTTFGTLAHEMKRRERYESRLNADPQARERDDEKCIFIDSKSTWYRVIIDEAQNIKNRQTKAAKAAYQLIAKSRFCLTGTPMMNSVDELFSLIHFLRIRPYNEWRRFNVEFSRPLKARRDDTRGSAMTKLQALLKATLLRRHKKTLVNGKPILQLPERTIEQTNPVFSDEEKDFYKALENQSQTQFNKYVRAGTVGRSYAHILVMLLRLRQACCHPHLIKDFGVALAADISEEDMIEYANTLDPAVVKRILESGGDFECPVCYDAVQNPAIFVPCGHDTCADCYTKIKDSAQGDVDENGGQTAKCPNCRARIDPKKVIDYETFKKVHMPKPEDEVAPVQEGSETESEGDETASETDSDDDDSETEDEDETLGGLIVKDEDAAESEIDDDSVKGQEAQETKAVKASARVSPIDSDEDGPPRSAKAKGKLPAKLKKEKKKIKKSKRKTEAPKDKKGKKAEKPEKKKRSQPKTIAELKKLSTRSKAARKEYLELIRKDYISSAKVDATMDLLTEILTETDEKIIVFSQWTSLLDLLEVPIDEKHWNYERYDGSMSAKLRADAVDNFKEPRKGAKNVRLMLVSLKAGNAGLNLNCASRVVILDPFWNPFVEEQAIDRAHRLGQERDVKVHRVLIEETVEDRIIALQEKKRTLVNEALDENAGQRLSRLSTRELGYLFGVTRRPDAALPSE